ncbi:conserved hypothetical protein [Ricinus communis]|uniref:Uncharacterized protein n=1 Tax=Ricinus communis TaxID=3988 RepID=B9T5G1_RICCO|nr:conserved hypothetical protein [Ricinus communis]
MNLRQVTVVCSSLPLLGCVVASLLLLFTSDEPSSSDSGSMVNDEAVSNNRAAQKHFRQIQQIRGA